MTDTAPKSEWFVYLVRTKYDALYCGITTDVERRFQQHQNGTGAKALRGRGPLTLAWSQPVVGGRSFASKLEHKLKKLPKKTKERLISEQLDWQDVICVKEG
ncbi:putative endonuclease [Vibrio xiamenensis]|uniref:Putative endonuclease n=1 Tax=Vibrio xiamenensis TaxID=861298 RepID=A0A1G7YRH4_9VIBR|nr:GIY-YIG nuclease family protein [Vibrio xiamenensis]SDG98977.1 putative endonuclease [Vibrio xiamenensis]